MDAEGLKELFEPFGAVTVKRMFGGHGIYADALCFAFQADGEVYVKCDEASEAEFRAAGSSPFVYMAKGKPMKMGYWRLVESAYDEPAELRRWASLGLEAARRAARAKAVKASDRSASAKPKSVSAKRNSASTSPKAKSASAGPEAKASPKSKPR